MVKKPKVAAPNLFDPPAPVAVTPYMADDTEPVEFVQPHNIPPVPIPVIGETDPSLDERFRNVTAMPDGSFYANIIPHEIPRYHGPHWENKFKVGMPRGTRTKDQIQLRELGLVGLYLTGIHNGK